MPSDQARPEMVVPSAAASPSPWLVIKARTRSGPTGDSSGIPASPRYRYLFLKWPRKGLGVARMDRSHLTLCTP